MRVDRRQTLENRKIFSCTIDALAPNVLDIYVSELSHRLSPIVIIMCIHFWGLDWIFKHVWATGWQKSMITFGKYWNILIYFTGSDDDDDVTVNYSTLHQLI